jgi:hypothetical protein
VVLVHVPEYSPELPETVALQAPFQACADLLAAHPPCIRILPEESWSIHVPVTPPVWSACAVHRPAKYPDCAVALQVPFRSAPEARMAVAAKVAKTQVANIVSIYHEPRAAPLQTSPAKRRSNVQSGMDESREAVSKCASIQPTPLPNNLRDSIDCSTK